MKIYTKTGDDGSTGLFGGRRVAKTHPRVAAYGAVDELNAALGVAIAAGGPPALLALLTTFQVELFVLGADLATPHENRTVPSYLPRIEEARVDALEAHIDEHEKALTPLHNFILPGGTLLAAHLHAARTICRRAERAAVSLAEQEDIGLLPVRYLNRLGDLLFVLARFANHSAGVPDVEWAPRKEGSGA
jgi:cob(I)alamin adenosyltransferase